MSGKVRDAILLRKRPKLRGAPGRIRTSDPQIRSLVLYPAELRMPDDWRITYYTSPRAGKEEILSGGRSFRNLFDARIKACDTP